MMILWMSIGLLVTLSTAVVRNSCRKDVCQTYDILERKFDKKIIEAERKMMAKIDTVEKNILQVINDHFDTIKMMLPSGSEVIPRRIQPFDCSDIHHDLGKRISGVYAIYPQGKKVNVYCDMDIDGGGWTVFLKRQKQSIQENFNRTWADYRTGFGTPPNEYWLGNEILHQMTNKKNYTIRIDYAGSGVPTKVWGEYSTFKIASEHLKYQLSISGRNNKDTMDAIRNGFSRNDQKYFTTVDRDNDEWDLGNCGDHGGFWHDACGWHFPTFDYEDMGFDYWSNVHREYRYATQIDMKIRPRSYDCSDIHKWGDRISGVYAIYPLGEKVNVYCDMDTDGGGWTVFLKRQRQAVQENFNRTWADYRNGFGNPSNEYWLGNELLHQMTYQKKYAIRIDYVGPGIPNEVWGEFSTFKVASETLKYQLSISGRNTEDTMDRELPGFLFNDKQYFSTTDRDNDNSNKNCAQQRGGFWHNDCSYMDPTGPYDTNIKMRFNYWSKIDRNYKSAIAVQMKFRTKKLT